MNRVAEVNKRLREAGRKEKLTRGRGYYYFRDGEAGNWYSTSVYIYSASDFSVKRWLEEFNDLKTHYQNRGNREPVDFSKKVKE